MCIELRKIEEKSHNSVFAPEKQQNPEHNEVWKVEFVKDGEVIGGACIARTKIYPFFIDHLWIDEEYRDQGYGKAAYLLVERWAKRLGVDKITLLTRTETKGFWKKMGFQMVDSYGEGDLEYLTADGHGNMIKNIDECKYANLRM